MSLLRLSRAGLNIPLARCIASDASRSTSTSAKLRQLKLPVPKTFNERSTTTSSNGADTSKDKYAHRQTPAAFLKHREQMKKRFPEGWNPPRKLSREAMEGLRTLHQHDPKTFSTPVLAERFRISPEAVRRILKSKWAPDKEEKGKMLARDRRRKEENIVKRIERERADKWDQLDSHEKPEESRRETKDGFSLV